MTSEHKETKETYLHNLKIDTTRPSAARMYDYYLGGNHNFEIDRQTAEKVLQLYPRVRESAMVNRAFLNRAVRFLVSQGIDQFLDLGSGIPTVGNVHEVAQEMNPEARVVYVDIDPIAVAHAETILEGNDRAACIQADARDVNAVLNHPTTRKLLDFSRPLGVMAVGFFYFIDEEGVQAILNAMRSITVSGSYLVISHLSDDPDLMKSESVRQAIEQGKEIYKRSVTPIYMRSRTTIESFFDGWELVEPGLVLAPLWRPESEDDLLLDAPEESLMYVGVGRKP